MNRVEKLVLCLLLCCVPLTGVLAGEGIQLAGDVLQYALPASGAGLTLAHKDGPGALQLGESLALTLGATYALKYGLNTTRPNGGHHSIPSGHASISFSAAEFMRKRYGWKYGVPAYATASFVAYSRVESRQHRAEDVIAGAGIGMVSSFIFTRPYKGWKVEAQGGRKYYGLALGRRW